MRCDASDIRFLEIDGLRTRVLVRNPQSGAVPLVMLNGLGQSIEVLIPLISEIDDRPVICFDMPGIGHSEMADHPLSIPDYADFTANVLRRLDVGTYDLMGISWGGAVAQQLAQDDAGRCRKMILAITSAGGLISWWGSPLALSEIALPLRFGDRGYGNFIGPLMYGGQALLRPGLFRDYSRHAVRPSLPGYYSQVSALCSWTSICWLNRITQPVLVIAGIFDALIPFPNQLVLAEFIPRAEMKVYPDGHLILYARRREIAGLTKHFLDRDHDRPAGVAPVAAPRSETRHGSNDAHT